MAIPTKYTPALAHDESDQSKHPGFETPELATFNIRS